MYEFRVVSNGKGDIKLRTSLFKSVFRVKLNNWWMTHAAKIESREQIEEKNEVQSQETKQDEKEQGEDNLSTEQ